VFSFDVAAKLSLIMLELATDRLAREMATLTSETLTVAIRKAVARTSGARVILARLRR
jgi:hypothetical protein